MRFFVLFFLLVTVNIAHGADNTQNSQPLQLLNPQTQQPQNSGQSPQDIMQQEIRDILGPLPLPQNNVKWIALAIAAALLTLLLIYLFLRWKKNKPVPIRTPAEIALEEMELAKPLFEEGKLILYAEKITEILRSFIGKQFEITATSRTTHEFLRQIQQSQEQESPLYNHRQLLGDCLGQVDLIKFAQFSPNQSIVQDIETTVTSFITESSKKEEIQ